MASSFVPVANTRNGFTIVTQVVPEGPEQYGLGAKVSVTKLLKGEPKALGTVQIMIGIMTFLFGIIKTAYFPSVGIISGVTYWGSCIYITSGALCVAADKKTKPSLVIGSLVMNTISAVAAIAAIVLLSYDIALNYRYCYGCFYRHHEGQSLGISLVLLVFSLLELFVAICTSAFACQATDALNLRP